MKTIYHEYLAQGKIDEAVDSLLEQSNLSIYNEIIMISSRYSFLKNQVRNGILSNEQLEIGRNKIIKSILDILQEVNIKQESVNGANNLALNAHSFDEYLFNSDLEYFSQAIAEAFCMTFVDLMRMFCVTTYPRVFESNIDRYEEFIEVGNRHFQDFRNQIDRGLSHIPNEQKRKLTSIERQINWNLNYQLRRPNKPIKDTTLINTLRDLSIDIHSFCISTQIKKYLIEHEIAQKIYRENKKKFWNTLSLENPLPSIRFGSQSDIITNRKGSKRRLRSIGEDSLYSLSFLYFSTDYFLLYELDSR